MFALTHRKAAYIQGIIWLMIGSILVTMGYRFLMVSEELKMIGNLPLLHSLSFLGINQATVILVLGSILIGGLKGYYVLAKAASKQLLRLAGLPSPMTYSQLFEVRYLLLVGLMIGLGFLLRTFPVDVRGCVDLAIGIALLFGSTIFFRQNFL